MIYLFINFEKGELRKRFNYFKLLEKIEFLLSNKAKENEELLNTKEIIDLDINRTHFEEAVEEKRKVLFAFSLNLLIIYS